MEIDLNEAQAKLHELGKLAWDGQDIVITRKGKPYLLLVVHSGDNWPDSPAHTETGISGKIDNNQSAGS